jgi:hypothetical protein
MATKIGVFNKWGYRTAIAAAGGLSSEELSGRIALCTTTKLPTFQGWKSATELYKPYILSDIIYLIIL